MPKKKLLTELQAKKLKKLGINSTIDLLLYLPNKYNDQTVIQSINDTLEGQKSQIEANINDVEVKYRPKKNLILYVSDLTGHMQIRFLHYYPSQIKQLESAGLVRFYGDVRQQTNYKEMIHPEYYIVNDSTELSKNLTPIYSTTKGLSQNMIRKLIKNHIESATQDKLFKELFLNFYEKYNFPSFMDSISFLHEPPKIKFKDIEAVHNSKFYKRLIYDELLAQQLFLRKQYNSLKKNKSPKFKQAKLNQQIFLEQLNFKLTDGQKQVLEEIQSDFTKGFPMNRLLQGDVGCGKTVVATIAAIDCIEAGFQVAFMAPTEILAEQHYEKLMNWFKDTSYEILLLTGSMSKKAKLDTYLNIEKGNADIVIGTHALFQEAVTFNNLGLYIIDEQHRFGVEQRMMLKNNSRNQQGYESHQLMMSATPIPRTLSMSFFAHMDVSTIKELPGGRRPIRTKVYLDDKRKQLLSLIDEHCKKNNQVFWVCPLIEESEFLDLETVNNTYKELEKYFNKQKVALIHGRMKAEEKKEIMKKFQQNTIQILVATSVIEVGVDVPNATLMIIENSERLGLSQLHQLRGRIGRGEKSSFCILLYKNKLSSAAKQRLRIIYENIDGFKIAEEDLKLRGPGELLGYRQSGVPTLRFANLNRDLDILKNARNDADSLIKKNDKRINEHMKLWLRNFEEIVTV
ncbi:ATP-dependent DNA helicase RecG [Methylophilaceae bacterium]|nr:ATP-dependent DNA helicase RecG [Methylophilaceae bacterium]